MRDGADYAGRSSTGATSFGVAGAMLGSAIADAKVDLIVKCSLR
jgi:hypothetical protein